MLEAFYDRVEDRVSVPLRGLGSWKVDGVSLVFDDIVSVFQSPCGD